MSRLTDHDFLHIHDRLAHLWAKAPGTFGYLSAQEQWCLHDYFQPSKNMSDLQLLAHRQAISAARPSLPQRAGRALTKLDEAAAVWALRQVRPKAVNKRKPQAERHVTVRAVVRPEVDPEKLARAFINLAQDIARKQPPK